MSQSKKFLMKYAVVLIVALAVTLFALSRFRAWHGGERELSLIDALEKGKAREFIRQHESKLSDEPDQRSSRLTLAVMYALSSRLDDKLDDSERNRHRSEAIRIAREAFNTQLSYEYVELDALLYSGSTLAQIYAVLGATNEMRAVFAELINKASHDSEALWQITQAMNLLENHLDQGYPLVAKNPFEKP
jgi:hypothetical protein